MGIRKVDKDDCKCWFDRLSVVNKERVFSLLSETGFSGFSGSEAKALNSFWKEYRAEKEIYSGLEGMLWDEFVSRSGTGWFGVAYRATEGKFVHEPYEAALYAWRHHEDRLGYTPNNCRGLFEDKDIHSVGNDGRYFVFQDCQVFDRDGYYVGLVSSYCSSGRDALKLDRYVCDGRKDTAGVLFFSSESADCEEVKVPAELIDFFFSADKSAYSRLDDFVKEETYIGKYRIFNTLEYEFGLDTQKSFDDTLAKMKAVRGVCDVRNAKELSLFRSLPFEVRRSYFYHQYVDKKDDPHNSLVSLLDDFVKHKNLNKTGGEGRKPWTPGL